MPKDARMSRRELFTGWRKRLNITDDTASGEDTQRQEQEQQQQQQQAKSLVREKAFDLMDSGDLEEAIQTFRSYIRQELNDDEARMALGSCLYEKEQLVQAKVEFERVLRIRKNDSLASLYLALTLLRMEKFEKAMKSLAAFEEGEADPLQGALVQVRTTLEAEGSGAMPAAISVLESRLLEECPKPA